MHVIEVRDIFTLADIAVQDKKHIFANTLFLLFSLPEACFGYHMMALCKDVHISHLFKRVIVSLIVFAQA